MFRRSPVLIFVCLLGGCFLVRLAHGASPSSFSKIVVFGDSFSDSGNVSQRLQSQAGATAASSALSFSLGHVVESANPPQNLVRTSSTLPQVWVALRSDRAMGSGTVTDPFDGSTVEKFDAVMAGIDPGCEIHLQPGTYTTRGIHVKEGWRLRGAGKFATAIRLVSGVATTTSAQAFVVSHFDFEGFLGYFEMSDLTIDCNRTSQPVYEAKDVGSMPGTSAQRMPALSTLGP